MQLMAFHQLVSAFVTSTRFPVVSYRADALSPSLYILALTRYPHPFPLFLVLFPFPSATAPALANWAHYAATYAFSTNSLRRCCYQPTAHCNKSGDFVDPLEKLRFHRKLHPELQHVAN